MPMLFTHYIQVYVTKSLSMTVQLHKITSRSRSWHTLNSNVGVNSLGLFLKSLVRPTLLYYATKTWDTMSQKSSKPLRHRLV